MLCMPGKIKTDLLESFTTQSQSNFPNRLQMSFHNRFEVHKGPFHHHHKWVGVLFRLSFELFSFQVIPSPCFLFHFIVLLQKWGQSSHRISYILDFSGLTTCAVINQLPAPYFL
jgi:hypothetical protein